MSIPKTELELRLQADAVVSQFENEIRQKEGCENFVLNTKEWALGIWIARAALRTACPHLKDSAEQDLTTELERFDAEQSGQSN
jgi:hypothetical protein